MAEIGAADETRREDVTNRKTCAIRRAKFRSDALQFRRDPTQHDSTGETGASNFPGNGARTPTKNTFLFR